MEKDKEVECEITLRLNIFNTYWNIMKRNYKDTQHDEIDFKYYYSIFREYDEQDFIKAIKLVLKYQPYFPRVDEIVKYLPDIDGLDREPNWLNKNIEIKRTTELEQKEIDEIVNELIGE